LLRDKSIAMAGFHDLRMIPDGALIIDDRAAIRFTLEGVLRNHPRMVRGVHRESLVLSVRKGTEVRELHLYSAQLRRELENAVERLLEVEQDENLALAIWCTVVEPLGPDPRATTISCGDKGPARPLRERVESFERAIIAEEFEAARHNQSETARRLGVSRPALIAKLNKYGVQRG